MPPLLLNDIRNFGKSYETLRELVKPMSSDQPISDPWMLYDTQLYPQAGIATGQLTFFKSTAANLNNQNLSNFPTGLLPKDEFFEIHRIFTFIHSVPNLNVAAAITGAAQDVEILHKTAQTNLRWSFAGREYGPFPLWAIGRAGGPTGQFEAFGTGTVANNIVSSGNTENNGGFPVLGSQIIAEQQQFSARMDFVASTAISAATNIVVALMGVYHRPVR